MPSLTGHLASGRTGPAPAVEVFLPAENPDRIGLIVLAGGGYGGLSSHEGTGMAEHFRRAGIACFTVSYRLGPAGHRHPAMLEDALSAVAVVREQAASFGVDSHRIGIMGSSAGGHLAAHTLVAWDAYPSAVSLRPDFGLLCYPVIMSSGPHAHAGSMINLAGAGATHDQLAALSCDRLVRADTPPCFLWHTGEDPYVPVENSLAFASALRRHGVPFELHVYQQGGHGLGLNTPFNWAAEALRWMRAGWSAQPARAAAS